MNDLYQRLDRLTFSRLDPERSHAMALNALAAAAKAPGGLRALARYAPEQDERLRQRFWGLPFANPLGAAAGLDKNGVAVAPLLALGFGHVEVGTVTLRPQPGNDAPRLWRVPEEQAVINALGFPSAGAASVRNRLAGQRPGGIVGINIGKNRDIPAGEAAAAYADLTRAVGDIGMYITVNVSSPNTPGLRSLQMAGELQAILKAVNDANNETAIVRKQLPKPVLVKIAPDLSKEEIVAVAEAAEAGGASGIIATNTTTSRAGIPEKYADLPGGLSGPPLKEQANAVMRTLYATVGKRLTIIGVGGISNATDVIERMRAGASLVQLYTAFIYGGPALPGNILRALSRTADEEGWRNISEIVGQG
jgi:dihydroorotate dehydrogenase